MEYTKEFKQAISDFSSIEKDRLIFRLLKKDKILSQKLYFELIDHETVDQKREKMEILISEKMEFAAKNLRNPKYFLLLIRKISAEIALHIKVTTDKFGEIYLNLFLIKKVLELGNEMLSKQSLQQTYKLYIYLINKVFKAISLLPKIDEDYILDLREASGNLKIFIEKNQDLHQLFLKNQFKMIWLKELEVPENMVEIIRNLKAEGWLK